MSNNMATSLKRKLSAKNITAIIVFGAIILVFAFFGMQTGSSGYGAAARVNESLISFREFQTATQQLEEMYSQYMGGRSFDPQQRKMLRAQAIERLINDELTAQAARRNGIRASDEEIRNLITKEIPAFQKDGQFQREFYSGYLQSQGLTPGEFETKVRKQIEGMRLRRLFEVSSRTLSIEADKQKSLQNLKMNLQFVKFDDSNPATSLVSNQEVEKALNDKDFATKVENEFNLKKGQLSQPEQVRAQHILVSFKQGDATSEKVALEKIQNLKKQTANEDFGTLASKNSDDPGSKAKKGDLGFFGRGAMVKEFEDVAFQSAPGQVSEPVKTPFGYHLIKVNEKKAAKEAQLADHKMEIGKQILAKDKLQAKAQEIETALASNPEKVEAELKALGLKWEETGLFPLDSSSVPKVPQLEIEKVAGLTSESPYLKNLVRVDTARYLIKLKELKQEAGAPNPMIEEMAQRRRAEGMFTTWIQDFKKNSDIETNEVIFQ